MTAIRRLSTILIPLTLSLAGAAGCDLEEVEDTVVPACENLRADCSSCCQDEGFDRGAYAATDETCFCKTVLDE